MANSEMPCDRLAASSNGGVPRQRLAQLCEPGPPLVTLSPCHLVTPSPPHPSPSRVASPLPQPVAAWLSGAESQKTGRSANTPVRSYDGARSRRVRTVASGKAYRGGKRTGVPCLAAFRAAAVYFHLQPGVARAPPQPLQQPHAVRRR